MKILYETSLFDHVPFDMVLNVAGLPEMTSVLGIPKVKLDWGTLTNVDLLMYYGKTNALLSDTFFLKGAILRAYFKCNDTHHDKTLCAMYDEILAALYEASRSCYAYSAKAHNIKPG